MDSVATNDRRPRVYYEHPPNDDDRRHVTVPVHDELRTGTLRSIAESAGANDFDAFCEWVDRNA